MNVLSWNMRVVSEQAQLRRKSAPSSIYLHIPYINIFFFFFMMRGAYTAIRNKYYQDQKLPSLVVTLGLSLKVSFFGAAWSSLLYLILLSLDMNPFGEIAAFYWDHAGDFFAGLFSPGIAAMIFPQISASLRFAIFNLQTIQISLMVIFVSYLGFGLIGGLLARFNIREDQLRNPYI